MSKIHFSFPKLLNLMLKFEKAITISSLLWNQGARTLPGLTYSLVASKLNMLQLIRTFYSSLMQQGAFITILIKWNFALLSQASNHE